MALGRPLFARPRWRSVPASGKVAANHRGAFAVEDGAPGQATSQNLSRRGGADPVGFQENDRLSNPADRPGDDQLVGCLHGLTRASWAPRELSFVRPP